MGSAPVDACRLARKHLLHAGCNRYRCLAFADDDGRAGAILAHLDPVQARAGQRELRVRRIDASHLAGVEHAHANDDAAVGDEQREHPIVEPRDVHVRIAGEPELSAAVVDLGAPVVGDPEIVTTGYRRVAQRLDPVLCPLLGRDVNVAAQVGEAADAARQIVVLRARERREGEQKDGGHAFGLSCAAGEGSGSWSSFSSRPERCGPVLR